jgi:predicted MFS family arabinose efflux permease
MQAYIGQRIPYQRRGSAIGILETSWAGSSLIGIPLLGLIIHRLGWRAPFFGLFGLGLLGIFILSILIPSDRKFYPDAPSSAAIWDSLRQLLQKRTALGAIGFSLIISAANDNLFVIYGVWLEKAFGLGIVALGIATTVIGIAELAGELLTAAIADRIGLLRTIIIGTILSVVAYMVLLFTGQRLFFALGVLFFVFLFFEFTIVTAISLYTEILPDSRATMMSGHSAAGSLGRFVGALIGGPVWLMGGIHAVGLVSAALTGLSILSLLWGFRGWRPKH